MVEFGVEKAIAGVGGNFYWYRRDDRFIGQRVALGKYEPYLTRLMLESVDENSVAVDVGANIGYDTVMLAKKVKKVYSFEPERESADILGKNVRLNGLNNVVIFDMAVGAERCKKWLYLSKTNYGDNRLFGKGKGVGVEMVKLDDVIGEKVDLIKIDTQGYEPMVIAGARKIIEKFKPAIVFEYWPWAYDRCGADAEGMMDFLERVYGGVYFVDEYIQIFQKRGKPWIDDYCVKAKSGDCNLMVVKEVDYWRQIKDFWFKKWLKRKLGRPLT